MQMDVMASVRKLCDFGILFVMVPLKMDLIGVAGGRIFGTLRMFRFQIGPKPPSEARPGNSRIGL